MNAPAKLFSASIIYVLFLLIADKNPAQVAFPPRTLASFGLEFGFGNGVIQGKDGNLYGTALNGGDYGYGAAFKITPAGKLTILASFKYVASPNGNLVQGTDGNFYGATDSGGTNGGGTLFRLSPSGTLTTIVSSDLLYGGGTPSALLQGTNGNLYGTDGDGGTNGRAVLASLWGGCE
jgi:uncharacterized repeat protein (TIGR03803 family)